MRYPKIEKIRTSIKIIDYKCPSLVIVYFPDLFAGNAVQREELPDRLYDLVVFYTCNYYKHL